MSAPSNPIADYLSALDGGDDVPMSTIEELWRLERVRERRTLGDDADTVKLEEFVKWVGRREKLKALGIDAPIDQGILEYVAQGVNSYLDGEKRPWLKKRGNKNKRDLTWECYWLTNFYKTEAEKLPQHKESGGAYTIVGKKLNLNANTIESHVRKAREIISTPAGKRDFELWLSDYAYSGGDVVMSEKKC
jgi:hypothetical protein